MGKVIKAIKNLFGKKKQDKGRKKAAKKLWDSTPPEMRKQIVGTCKKPAVLTKEQQEHLMINKGSPK